MDGAGVQTLNSIVNTCGCTVAFHHGWYADEAGDSKLKSCRRCHL